MKVIYKVLKKQLIVFSFFIQFGGTIHTMATQYLYAKPLQTQNIVSKQVCFDEKTKACTIKIHYTGQQTVTLKLSPYQVQEITSRMNSDQKALFLHNKNYDHFAKVAFEKFGQNIAPPAQLQQPQQNQHQPSSQNSAQHAQTKTSNIKQTLKPFQGRQYQQYRNPRGIVLGKINRTPQLKQQFIRQHQKIMDTLDKMYTFCDTDSQLAINDLRYSIAGLSSEELNYINQPLQNLVTKLQHVLYDQDGSFRGINSTQLAREATAHHVEFLKEMYPCKYLQLVKERADANIGEFKRAHQELTSWSSWIGKKMGSLFFGQKLDPNLPEKIQNYPFNQDLRHVKQLCQAGKWNQVQTIVDQYKDTKHFSVIDGYFKEKHAAHRQDSKQEATIDQQLDPQSQIFTPAIQDLKQQLEQYKARDFITTTPTQEQIQTKERVQTLLDYFTESLQSTKTIEEQALILNIIDQLAHALELNAKGEINKFSLDRVGAFGQRTIVQALKGLHHNVTHPLEYFVAPVVATAEFAYYCVEMAALGEYVTNFGEQGLSPEQLERLNSVENAFNSLQETLPKLTAEQWGDITGQALADIAFGVGLSKTPKMLRYLAKAAEINKRLKPLAESTWQKVISKAAEKAGKNVAQAEYTFTKTTAKHLSEVVMHGKHKGEFARSYMRSSLVIQEIVATGKGIPDATAKNALNFRVPGTFRSSQGIWELVIDPEKKIIYHFLFRKGTL